MFGRLFLPNQVTRFVILFIERDGSTYLTSLLMSHSSVKAVYERFSVMRTKGQSGQEQLDWMRKFMSPSLISRKGAIGFKTKLIDILAPADFIHQVKELDCKIIHMNRRNHVKAVVSKVNAKRLYQESGKWNLYDPSNRMPPMKISPGDFDRLLFERSAAEDNLSKFIARLDQPTIRVTYEDMLADRDIVLNSVFDFLGISHQPVKSKTLKHTSDDLREVLLNFDQLRAHYEGTDYGPMFDSKIRPAA